VATVIALSWNVGSAEPSCTVDDDCSTIISNDDEYYKPDKDTDHNTFSWFEDATKDFKFLQEHVFGQKQEKGRKWRQQKIEKRQDSFAHLFSPRPPKDGDSSVEDGADDDGTSRDEQGKKEETSLLSLVDTLKGLLDSEHPDQAILKLLLKNSATGEDDARSFQDTAKLFLDHAQEVLAQVQRTFGPRLDNLSKYNRNNAPTEGKKNVRV